MSPFFLWAAEMRSGGDLNRADERLASNVADGERRQRRSTRRYRCGRCGVLQERDEMLPEYDENGRRVGWACDSCW